MIIWRLIGRGARAHMIQPKHLTVFVLLALLTACGRQQNAQQQPPPPEVAVVTLKAERVMLRRELAGRTNAFLVAEVRPQVSGIVQERLFTEGGMVEAGQPLYQLDDAVYRAQYDSARAALQRAKASLELARLNAARSEQLARADAVSRQEKENAEAALAQAEAELGVAEAAVQSASVMLGYTRITAPIGGRIGKSSVTQGALVTANQPAPLATIQQLDPIYVDLNQSSREFLELRKNIANGSLERPEDVPVKILLEDGTPYDHPGELAFSEVTVDPTTGSFGLRIVVPNPDHILLPGMFVRAELGTGIREDAILVPQRAVSRNARGDTSVMVITGDGRVEARAISVSRSIGSAWLVEAGLLPGDRVVVEGLQKIQPGIPVRVVEAAQTDATPTGPAPAETAPQPAPAAE